MFVNFAWFRGLCLAALERRPRTHTKQVKLRRRHRFVLFRGFAFLLEKNTTTNSHETIAGYATGLLEDARIFLGMS